MIGVTAPLTGRIEFRCAVVPGNGYIDFDTNTYSFTPDRGLEVTMAQKLPAWLKERYEAHVSSGWWVLVLDPDLAVDEGL